MRNDKQHNNRSNEHKDNEQQQQDQQQQYYETAGKKEAMQNICFWLNHWPVVIGSK